MLKKYNKTILISIIFLFAISLVFCNPNQEEQAKEKPSLGFSQISDQNNLQNDNKTYYRFPSAKEMFLFIKKDDTLSFKSGIVNDINNQSFYLSTPSKTLNLGVYLTDLTYLVLFKRTSNTFEYFETIQSLSHDLHINIPFTMDFVNRVKVNINNEDSIIAYSDQYTDLFYNNLISNNKEHTLAVISAGSYIESLYIAIHLIDEFSANDKLVQKIADQKYPLKNIQSHLSTYKEFPYIEQTSIYIDDILKIYNDLEISQSKTTTHRTAEGKLIIDGGNKIKITHEQFEHLKTVVSEIRNKIINDKSI